MHIGKSYRLGEFLLWTRRSILWHIINATIPTVLYQVFDIDCLAIPWSIIALLGSATAFIIGFKNVQTYNRTWEARQIWGAVMAASWSWALVCRDFIDDKNTARKIIYRHFAWITALRYQLRTERNWETTNKPYNKEYKKFYAVPERETPLVDELTKYISNREIQTILPKNNKAIQLLRLQSIALGNLRKDRMVDHFQFVAMHNLLQELCGHQGRCERIKNFPYPRQYATINSLFLRLFCLLLPFGLLGEFNKLNDQTSGMMQGYMAWLVIPFSVLISWVFTSLEQVGESTENPFEGSPNDVSISQMSRVVEIDIREMLGESDLPPTFQPRNNIIL